MRRQRAQGLVEFALISSLLLLLFFVILDGGRAIYTYQTVAEVTREGAHAAELADSTDAQIRSSINTHAGLLGDLGSASTITPTASRTAMQTVTVKVTYHFRMITPLLSQFGPIDFTSQTVVVVE
jgi:Flp pilus assembly protein TadG